MISAQLSRRSTTRRIASWVGALALVFAAANTASATTLTIADTSSATRSFTSTLTRTSSSRSTSRTANVNDRAQTSLRLDQFNAALGTLQSIRVVGRATLSRRVGSVTVTCRDSGLINSACASSSGSQSSSGFAELDAPFDASNQFRTTFDVSIAQDQFAGFIGTGSVEVPWQVTYSHRVLASCTPSRLTDIEQCNVTGRTTFDFFAEASVVYGYTAPPPPVPLPAGLPLMLAGLGALAVLRRRA